MTDAHTITAEGLPHACEHGAAVASIDGVTFDRFLRGLVDREPFDAQFSVGAMYGKAMRDHVDQCHPDQVDDARSRACPRPPFCVEVIEGWLYGYDWRP